MAKKPISKKPRQMQGEPQRIQTAPLSNFDVPDAGNIYSPAGTPQAMPMPQGHPLGRNTPSRPAAPTGTPITRPMPHVGPVPGAKKKKGR